MPQPCKGLRLSLLKGGSIILHKFVVMERNRKNVHRFCRGEKNYVNLEAHLSKTFSFAKIGKGI